MSLRIKLGAIVRMVLVFALLASLSFPYASLAQEVEGDTVSISLVQEATVKKPDVSAVPYERYTVKKGDHLWQILRDKGLITGPDISELLSAIRGMNNSLENLDLIHPGQTILIPLEIVPERLYKSDSLEGVSLENYVVKSGDSISKVVMSKYAIPPNYLYNEYLDLVQTLNPTIKNVDLIYPNQVINLPIYSPEIVGMSIEKPFKAKPKMAEPLVTASLPKSLSLIRELRDIFDQIGEEWVSSGEQFIPLKSGGHVKLKPDSFPMLNLRNGRMLIIDPRNELPEDIARLIESDCQAYKVVRLAPDENLKAVLNKLFAASGYYNVLGAGESLKLQSDIDITLAGDWVIVPKKAEGNTPEAIIALSLIGDTKERTPMAVKTYLKRLGVTVIDYPDSPTPKKIEEETPLEKIPLEQLDRFSLPTLLLHLAGQPFSSEVKIPIYQSSDTGFNLIIHADLFFNRRGGDCIVDTTGLSADITELLIKRQFRVLSLAGESPHKITELVLDFLDVEFDPRPHDFLVSSRDEARNIMLTVQGISFSDKDNRKILATDTTLPDEIVAFLNQKGYHLLELGQLQATKTPPSPAESETGYSVEGK